MHIHIALYRWKTDTSPTKIEDALKNLEKLRGKIPGLVEISYGENKSQFSEGYSHVILIRGETAEAIQAYRDHPDHQAAALAIESIEQHGIGVDFTTD